MESQAYQGFAKPVVTLDLPETMLLDIKQRAGREGMPYQSFMRRILEPAVRS